MSEFFYRKRRYFCTCKKRFAEKNPIVDRYQRFSKEWNQMAQIRAVKGKTFKETALQYGTSVSTIIRRFDRIVPTALKETQLLPSVIAMDEFKGNAGQEKFQLMIADAVTKQPIDILPNRKKETIEAYLQKYGANVDMVVMDMSHSFKASVQKALNKPLIIADHFHFVCYIYWAMERVRIRIQREWHDYDRKKVKKKRFVFLKKSAHLKNTTKLADRNPKLFCLWLLKWVCRKAKQSYQGHKKKRFWLSTIQSITCQSIINTPI